MKQLLVLCSIFMSIIFLAAPIGAGAFSECVSLRKGVCIRLDPPHVSATRTPRGSSLLLAASPPFPGLEFLSTYGIDFDTNIGDMLSALYNFGVAIAGISALIVVTYAGVAYMVAVSESMISDAKRRALNALFGLVIIATSYLVLYTINPDFSFTLKLAPICAAPPCAVPVTPTQPPAPFAL